ncbi:E3 ubiquitin-protein ligase KEG [Acorus gramineus]|uniref:RING-type E3 ubiquitin transferase n=1 Tax=Acorus gramineus TaxID=55184 RepID=A0AAV9BMI3_ACOGR|nr:E3 ubiquitin-protein ligase KEG [Acorus gramineus]
MVRRLGEGQTAGRETWAAVLSGSRGCRHRVAVKRVASSATEGLDLEWVKGQLDRLQRASMWCSNACAFHGAMTVGENLCLVMDQYCGSVEGEMKKNNGRLTLEQILRYGADIARGVAELHAAGVFCMNIKPSNLLLDTSGRAVVSDYGLPEILKKTSCRKARAVPDDDTSKTHSCMDCTMLSPHYTAPEAWEPLKKSLFWEDTIGISKESDAWSFGCTLVEMCTGSIPWAGLSPEEIYRAVVKARRQPPQYASVVGVGIPRELWKMIGECLQFKASKRPTFHDMLPIFLRQLQGLPRNPPASPDKYSDFAQASSPNAKMPLPTPVLEVFQDNPSILHQLISEGDLNGVRDLLMKVASEGNSSSIRSLLEAQNSDGQTALHLSCRRGCAELVRAILEYKEVDVDILDKDGDPPIFFALAAGSPECVRALLRRSNVSLRLKEGLGSSVAHICACHGQPECMHELLLAGADPNSVDDEGESVLHKAVAKKYTDCAIAILENGGCSSMGILNSKNKTPLHICIETWNVAVVRRWVEVASSEEIKEAIDIQGPSGTALCMAAALKKDHEIEGRELVKQLLHAGADPTAQDTKHGRTVLHMAAMVNDAELIKIILDAGVDVNIRNVNNTIPLHVALNRGAKLCVGLLLSAGANCNLQDDEGDNAFHIAADAAKMIRENLGWIVTMLQYPNAALEVRNHSGMTFSDLLEALPREWISEDLMEALMNKGIHLSPTRYEVGDWVKFKRSVSAPAYGWQGANHRSVGFVQNILDDGSLNVSFCSGEGRILASDVIKVIPLNRGQHVQLKPEVREPRYGWRGQSRDSIGTVLCVDDDGILRVGFPGASRGWRADPAEMERVEEFKVGDWVRVRPSLTTAVHGLGSVTPGSIGIVYCIRPDNSLLLDLSYLSSPWLCEPEEVELVDPFRIGDQVCVKRSVAEPKFGWGGETHHSVGTINEIESDGLLIIEIPNRPIPWQADPSDMEKVENFKVGDWVRVKASVPSPKYGWEDVTRTSIGIIHSLEDDGDMGVAFCFRCKPFCCSVADMEKVPPFDIGQEIHIIPSITQPQLGWSNETTATTGKISRIDMDGTLNVRVPGRSSLWKVSPGDVERLSGFEVGDWVRLKPALGARPSYDWNSIGKESLAVVHSVQDTGYLELAGCFRKGRLLTHYMDVEKVPSLKVGDHIRFRAGIVEPRWGWRDARPDSRGVITAVHSDGEVRVAFSSRPGLWRGDPADLEKEDIFEVGDWVRLRDEASEWKSLKPGSIGIVQGIGYEGDVWDGSVLVGFCGEQERWVGPASELERVDRLVVGQRVRMKQNVKQPRFGWAGQNHVSIGTISSIDADGKLRIYTPVGSKVWMLDPAEVEMVEEEEMRVGDWVRVKATVSTPSYQWGNVSHSSVGVIHRIEDDGELWVAFCFLERLWLCKTWEMERVRPFRVGDRVRIREGLLSPRWGWGMETHSSRGEIVGVDANGKLRIRFKWRQGSSWIGDPADIVLDESFTVSDTGAL